MFTSKDVDVLTVIVPKHWNALALNSPCPACKDVYVKKTGQPQPFENQELIKAAARYGRKVEAGIPSRIPARKPRDIELLR